MGSNKCYLICDNSKEEKLPIPDGETTIGRGPFLKIHTNPTFFWPDDGKYIILEQNEWKTLNNDDKISLLPSDLFFSVEVSQNDDIKSNQEQTAPSNDQMSETKTNKEQFDLEKAKENEVLQNILKSGDKDEAPQLAESAVEAHEGTFEDSIDSLEDEKFCLNIKKVLDNGTEVDHTNGGGGSEVKNSDSGLRINETKVELTTSSGKGATGGLLKEKKRVLPSWMLDSSPAKGAVSGKKNAAKSSRGGSLKRKTKSDESFAKSELDEKDKSLTLCSSSKRSKQEDAPIQGAVDGPNAGVTPEGKDTKCMGSEYGDNRSENSKETDIIVDAMKSDAQHRSVNDVKWEVNEVGRTLGDESEEIKLPVNNEDENSISEGRSGDGKIPQAVTTDEVKGIHRSKEDSFQSGAAEVQSESCAEQGSARVPEEVKKKLPKCQYGKSCYRKNPVHFQEYSHSDVDSDGDGQSEVDADNKPECPYGTSCYRKNPQHKLEYKHTKPASGQKSTRKTKRKSSRLQTQAKKSVLAGDSDDDGEENDYDYDDSFIDDDDDDDDEDFQSESSSSYQDDDDDGNWSPDDLG